jgi:hypothetical protein
MDAVSVTPNITMLRISGWQVYVWRDDDAVTVIEPAHRDRAQRFWLRCHESTGSC